MVTEEILDDVMVSGFDFLTELNGAWWEIRSAHLWSMIERIKNLPVTYGPGHPD